MSEIPVKIGPSLKWISGISNNTTCKDILISLLKTETLLQCPEDYVHHHYALVESWREVSKVLPANSLILKIWSAWGEEQQNVSFTVKTVKNKRKEDPGKVEETEQNVRKVQKRLRRRNSRNSPNQPVDTLHPKAFARNKQIIGHEIEDQMKKIIKQGDIIKRHLLQLKLLEAETTIKAACDESHLILSENDNLNDSGNVTDRSDDSETNKDNHQDILDIDVGDKNTTESLDRGDTEFVLNINPLCDNNEVARNTGDSDDSKHGDTKNKETKHDDTKLYIEMLENVHRLNTVLESKEESLLKLENVLKMSNLSRGQLDEDSPPASCFPTEVTQYRELNVHLLAEIQENSSVIQKIQEKTEERKKLVSQLEFDVNMVEKESKRLQKDLSIIQNIGTDSSRGSSVNKEYHGTVQLSNPSSLNQCDIRDQISSEKSVRFIDQEAVNLIYSSNLKTDLETESSVNRKPILKIHSWSKEEYNSDSDTGVSSLSSSEGVYSLSTMV